MTLDPIWTALVAKVVATMTVVLTAALVAERVGPFFGALVACLPVSAGPAYVLLALQSSDAFIAASALASATAVAATAFFLLAYVFLAPRAGVLASIAGGLCVWGVAVAAIRLVSWDVLGALALNAATFSLALALSRRADAPGQIVRARRRWFELPMTAVMVGLLVASVVSLSAALGPAFTGIAALFPVTFSSLALAVHPRLGGRVAAATMAAALKAMPGFALGLLVLHALAVPAGTALALLAALATMLAWSAALIAWRLHVARASNLR
ncbi:MAG: hypothetical protein ACM3O6_15475 [Acidobacteriota bacterium]